MWLSTLWKKGWLNGSLRVAKRPVQHVPIVARRAARAARALAEAERNIPNAKARIKKWSKKSQILQMPRAANRRNPIPLVRLIQTLSAFMTAAGVSYFKERSRVSGLRSPCRTSDWSPRISQLAPPRHVFGFRLRLGSTFPLELNPPNFLRLSAVA